MYVTTQVKQLASTSSQLPTPLTNILLTLISPRYDD